MRPQNIKSNSLGFTLVELLVVISVIGVIASVALVNMGGARQGAMMAKSKTFSSSIQQNIGIDIVGAWDFDEGSGTVAKDVSGMGSNGALINSPIWAAKVDCVSGTCLQFDGLTNYVEMSGLTLSKIAGNKLTVEAWAKPTSLSGTQYIVSKNGPFFLYMNGNKFSASIYNGTWTSLAGNIALNNNWQYLIMVYDGSNIKLYVNGVFDVSTPKSGNLAGNGCAQIGVYNNGGCAVRSMYFGGLIDEVRIYNEIFTVNRVRENYLAGLDRLLATGQITKIDYRQRRAVLNSIYAANE